LSGRGEDFASQHSFHKPATAPRFAIEAGGAVRDNAALSGEPD